MDIMFLQESKVEETTENSSKNFGESTVWMELGSINKGLGCIQNCIEWMGHAELQIEFEIEGESGIYVVFRNKENSFM